MKHNLLILSALIFLIGCSTEKDRRLNRFYHNTTAYYNGYFNAREILKEQNKEFAKNRTENYEEILTVNRFPNEEESKAWFPPMDLAIEKTSKVITKHAMPREKVGKYARTEYGKWMDENWLVIGQSYFYKREYIKAIETFKYVEKMYQKDPSKYHAKLWLAKTYLEMDNFAEANIYLQEIINEKEASERKVDRKEAKEKRRNTYKKKKRRKRSRVKVVKGRTKEKEKKTIIVPFPKKLAKSLEATLADYYVRKKDYKEGLLHLDSAIDLASKRRNRVRYTFVKAQLYQKMGQKSAAYDAYSYVIRKNPPYQMGFYAKINRALLANSSDRKGLQKELRKLAKDDKYIEFKDQIYYALAELELQDKNKPKAIEYLLQSAAAPASNETQKGKTHIKLADLYFDDQAYLQAQKYYDSSLTELKPDFPNYASIKSKSESLTDLVNYIDNVMLQDSLQEIAGLDDKQRLDRIEEILYANKVKKQQEEQDKKLKQNNTQPINPIAGNTAKGKFWMYNPQAKAFGKKEFGEKWGDVTLEDNWRRKNKNATNGGFEETETSDAPLVSDAEITEFNKGLPTTPEAIEESNIKIINSLYFSGIIYRDKLKDLPKAIASFEEIERRFHPNDRAVPGMYQLYKGYKEIGQFDKANTLKAKIISAYPASEEAKILEDPLYASRIKNAGEKTKNEYRAVFDLVQAKNNQQAIAQVNTILKRNDPNPYRCKLNFLKAQAYGNMQMLDSVESALKQVIKGCPSDTLAKIAQDAINKKKNIVAKQDAVNARDTLYKFEPTAEHLFIIVVPNGGFDMNKLKASLSNFNNSFFKPKALKTTSTFLDTKTQTVLIKSFANKYEAQSYYVAYKVNKKELKDFNGIYEYYTISARNFSKLFVSKDLEKYREFYKANYE